MINRILQSRLIAKYSFSTSLTLSIAFNILVLSNILGSDYFGDDLYNFQVPGLIPSAYSSISDFTMRSIVGWMEIGRLFPGAFYAFYIFDIFDTVCQYKLFILTITVFNVILFSYLIFILSKDRFLSILFILLTPLFFQYRYYHDPLLSFHGLMQVFFVYITLSLIFFTKHLQGGGKFYYYLSLLFFTISLLTYEISYVFILFFIPIMFTEIRLQFNIKKVLLFLAPYAVVQILLALLTIYLRSKASIGSGPYLPNWDLLLIFKTYFYQTTSVIPTTYFIMFSNNKGAINYYQHFYLITLLLFLLIYFITVSAKDKKPINKNLITLGILILLLPGLLLSISPKFQYGLNGVKFGLGYLPVYIQLFGASLLLALIIRNLSDIRYHIFTVVMLCVILFIHLVSNNQVIEKVNSPYKSNREILTLLFTGTFGSKLQDGAIIQFADESPLHRAEFLNMLTKKKLRVTIAPDNNYNYNIRYEVNDNFAIVSTKKNTGNSTENITVFKKNATMWSKVYDNSDLSSQNKVVLPPFFNGFYEWEGKAGSFRWAKNNANLIWINNDNKAKIQNISFETSSLNMRNVSIRCNGEMIDNFSIAPGVNSPHSYNLKLIPGRNIIEFISIEPAVKPSNVDTRDLTFSIAKFHPIGAEK